MHVDVPVQVYLIIMANYMFYSFCFQLRYAFLEWEYNLLELYRCDLSNLWVLFYCP